MTDDEKDKQDRELAFEAIRVSHARTIALAAGGVSIAVACIIFGLMWFADRPRVLVVLEPILAFSLSTTLVAGARNLDGAIWFGARRRDAVSSSSAAAMVLLWLGCFAAFETTFLVVDVLERWQAGHVGCNADGNDRLAGVSITTDHAGKRTVALVGCVISAKHLDDIAADQSKAKNAIDLTPETAG